MSANKGLSLALGFLLACASGIALADSDVRVVNCAGGGSIQDALDKKNADRPLTVVIQGTCMQDVTVTRDDVELIGESGAVNGTITVNGARRVLIRDLTVSSATGAGMLASANAAVVVQRSTFERNHTNGIVARRGAQVTVLDSSFRENGQETPMLDATRGTGLLATEGATVRVERSTFERNRTNGLTARAGAQVTVRDQSSFSQNGHTTTLPDTGRGIEATHDSSLDMQGATISGNRSDGVGVFNGSYARLLENTIEANGRLEVGEAGVQVNRSRVRANGNIIRNNTGSSAIIVVNHSDYRTGTGLNAVEFPDNEFAFERLEHAVGGVRLTVDLNNNSYADLRQVDIVGSIGIGPMSMLHLRGDDVGPNRRCSTVNLNGGALSVSGRNGLLRIRFTNVTPPAVAIGGPNGQVDGGLVCAVL